MEAAQEEVVKESLENASAESNTEVSINSRQFINRNKTISGDGLFSKF